MLQRNNPTHQPRLTEKDVHTIRERYFLDRDNLNTLCKDYNISVPTLKKAIHGKGPYENISDTIPEDVKINRKPLGVNQRTKRKIALRQNEIKGTKVYEPMRLSNPYQPKGNDGKI